MMLFTEAQLKAISKAVASNYGNPSKSTIIAYIRKHPPRTPVLYNDGASKAQILLAYYEVISSDDVLKSIQYFLDPVSFINNEESYETYRNDVNLALSFTGYEIDTAGKLRKIVQSKTLTEAQKRKDALISQIRERKMHPRILKYCRDELFENDYYSVVFESIKGVFDTVRELSGCKFDGVKLIDTVFSVNEPMLLINQFTTESEISAHKGFASLLRGLHGHFRNPAAHEVKIKWYTSEATVLELLGMVSYVYRVLDTVTTTCYAFAHR